MTTTSDPSNPTDTTVRIHITPLTAESSASLLPPSATNVSFHTLPAFPERPFAFATLPVADAKALKKKFHNTVFRGQKMAVTDARPENRIVAAAADETTSSKSDKAARKAEKKEKKEKKEKPKKVKAKAEQGVLPGFELPEGRKVQRGWDKKGECLVTVAVPPNRAALADETSKKKSKKRKSSEPETAAAAETKEERKERKKRKKLAVVKEGEKATIFPQFLKENQLDSKRGKKDLVRDFVDGVGWVDAEGKVVEKVEKKKKERVIVAVGEPLPREKTKKDATTPAPSKSSAKEPKKLIPPTTKGVVSFSDAESEDEAEAPVKPAAVVYHSSSESSDSEVPAAESSSDEDDASEDEEMASPPPSPPPTAKAISPEEQHSSTPNASSDSSDEEESSEDEEMAEPEPIEKPGLSSKREASPSASSAASSASSSSSEDDSDSDSGSDSDTESVASSASVSSLSSSSTTTSAASESRSSSPTAPAAAAASEPIKVHALEALYKPAVSTATSDNPTGSPSASTFTFGFGAGGDDSSSDEAEETTTTTVIASDATPYRDPARYRSGAPTPDTAAVSKSKHQIFPQVTPAPFVLGSNAAGSATGKLFFHHDSAFLSGLSQWVGAPTWGKDVYEPPADNDEEVEGGGDNNKKEKKSKKKKVETPQEGDGEVIGRVEVWKKTFYANRGEWNREWKRRRREAVKSRRRRERAGMVGAARK